MSILSARYNLNLALWPAAILLFSLPFTHTVAVRLLSLAIAAAMTFLTWRSRPTPPVPFKGPLLLWAGMALLSLTWAIDPGYSLGEIKNEIGYTMLAFLTFYSLTQGEREWKFLNRVLILSFLAISISGVLGYWLAHDKWVMGGLHGGVGDYSTYLITILPFLLLAAVKAPITKFSSNLVWLLLPILLMGGYLSLNRAFWPALIVVSTVFGLLYFFRTNSPRINKRAMGIAILLGILAVTQFIAVVKHKAAPTGTDAEILAKAMQEDPRIPLWEFAIENIRERPLTGAGFGRGVMRKTFTSHFNNGQLWHAHNMFLNYTVQMGAGGLLVVTVLFCAIGREFWMLYRAKDPDVSLIGITGLALLSGIIIKNMTDDFFVRHHALLFWALVGMLLGYGRRRLLAKSLTNCSQKPPTTILQP